MTKSICTKKDKNKGKLSREKQLKLWKLLLTTLEKNLTTNLYLNGDFSLLNTH